MINFCTPNRIEIGRGNVNKLGELLKSLSGVNALVVMDSVLSTPAIGLYPKIENICTNAGVSLTLYSKIAGEPTSENVSECLAVAQNAGCDCIVAIGGGSAIDVAKAVSVLVINKDLVFRDISKQLNLNRLPLIAIPTTAGTGSEATRVSVITNKINGIKENPGHWAMVPDVALIDAELMLTLPQNVTAFTGMDALTHAVEAYVSNKANELTDLYALEAIRIIGHALSTVVENGLDLAAREQMAVASCYAGIAFSNSSTNLAHAGGRALGAYFHVPHGLSVALLLPFVMEFGLQAAESRYAKVAIALGANPMASNKELAQQAIAMVCGYNEKFGIWTAGRDSYITNEEKYSKAIPEMVKNAMGGNGILTNPIVPTETDVANVFEQLSNTLFNGR